MDLFTYTQNALASMATDRRKDNSTKKFNRTEILEHIKQEYLRHYGN